MSIRSLTRREIAARALGAPAKREETSPGDTAALAKQSQNPVGDLASLPFRNNTTFSFGSGEDFKIGKQAVNSSAPIFYNVEKPALQGDRVLRFQFTSLFPK